MSLHRPTCLQGPLICRPRWIQQESGRGGPFRDSWRKTRKRSLSSAVAFAATKSQAEQTAAMIRNACGPQPRDRFCTAPSPTWSIGLHSHHDAAKRAAKFFQPSRIATVSPFLFRTGELRILDRVPEAGSVNQARPRLHFTNITAEGGPRPSSQEVILRVLGASSPSFPGSQA